MPTYVPRTLGGTLILNPLPPPPSTIPTLVVTAVFRNGQQQVLHRDGKQQALHRDGTATEGGR